MEMHGFSQISFCDRAKGRHENFSGRGETRKPTEVTLDILDVYIFLSRTDLHFAIAKKIYQPLILDLEIVI